jgi:hypothetical protein
MGGSAASRLTTAGSGVDGATLGASGGNQALASHTHTATSTVTDPGHLHTYNNGVSGAFFQGGSSQGGLYNQTSGNTSTATTGITVATTVATAGTGSSANIPPAIVATYIIKT